MSSSEKQHWPGIGAESPVVGGSCLGGRDCGQQRPSPSRVPRAGPALCRLSGLTEAAPSRRYILPGPWKITLNGNDGTSGKEKERKLGSGGPLPADDGADRDFIFASCFYTGAYICWLKCDYPHPASTSCYNHLHFCGLPAPYTACYNHLHFKTCIVLSSVATYPFPGGFMEVKRGGEATLG